MVHSLWSIVYGFRDRDEARDELDDLNEEAEMTHEELLKKYKRN